MTRSPDFDEGYRRAIEDVKRRCTEERNRYRVKGASWLAWNDAYDLASTLTPPPRHETKARCSRCGGSGRLTHDNAPYEVAKLRWAPCPACQPSGGTW